MNTQIIPVLIYAALLLFVALDATAQGKLAWLTREWVPPTDQPKVSFALHWLYPGCYTILAGVIWALTGRYLWPLVALLIRFAAFDPVLQWSRGDKLFSLGTSSVLDRLLGRAPWLNPILRAAALLGSVALLLL